MDGSDATLATFVDGSDGPGQPIPPDHTATAADSEIKDSTVFTWTIRDYSKLGNSVRSPLFECGGHKWRILLYPTGMDGKLPKYVSVYLDSSGGQRATNDWHECVKFQFTLCNTQDPSVTFKSQEVQHRFTADEPDWGFSRLKPLHELSAVQGAHPRPVIERDSVTISVQVRVFHDPTGILWHNFVDYNSRKQTGYVGLINQGATAYMNAVLQVLFHNRAFRRAVYEIPTEGRQPTNSIPLALQRIFYRLETSENAVSTTELSKAFGWTTFDSFIAHDFIEFNRVLQDKMRTLMMGTNSDGIHDRLFTGKMKSYIKAVNVDFVSSRIENYEDLQLRVKGLQNIAASFRDYIAVDKIDDYPAGKFGSQKAEMGIVFQSFPPVLHIQLKRFDYDIQQDAMVKLNDRFEYPPQIDLAEFLGPDGDKSSSLTEGHYETMIKPDRGSSWFKFDDDRVTPVLEKEVFEDGYGGISKPARGRGSDSSSNAYILIYIRESAMDEIFAPIPQTSIPPHLRLGLEEEQRRQDEKRREAEERLYMTIDVVTEESFAQHEGFDLAEFSRPVSTTSKIASFKVPRTEAYTAFKARVAKHLNYPGNRVRFWVLASRQNKTVRPDFRLPDDETGSMDSIRERFAALRKDLRLFVELVDSSVDRPSGKIFIFLKHFDVSKQTLTGSGALWVPRTSKAVDLTSMINGRMRWPPGTALKLYEEIKPTMVEPLKVNATLSQLEISDGDVICFQRSLPTREQEELTRKGHHADAIKFYQALQNRFLCIFSSVANNSQFTLPLYKTDNYDTMAANVGKYLSVDPLGLSFWTTDLLINKPKALMKRDPAKSLGDLLIFHEYFKPVIKYDISGPREPELRRGFSWMGHDNRKKSIHLLTLKKTDTLEEARALLNLQVETSLGTTGRIRFFLTSPDKKAQRPLAMIEKVNDIPPSTEIYAEEIMQDELKLKNGEKLIDVFHFSHAFFDTHGVPFKFVIRPGEKVAATRKRLQTRLGLSDEKFSPYRLAIQVSNFRQPLYLDEDEVLYDSKFVPQAVGLDHAEKDTS